MKTDKNCREEILLRVLLAVRMGAVVATKAQNPESECVRK